MPYVAFSGAGTFDLIFAVSNCDGFNWFRPGDGQIELTHSPSGWDLGQSHKIRIQNLMGSVGLTGVLKIFVDDQEIHSEPTRNKRNFCGSGRILPHPMILGQEIDEYSNTTTITYLPSKVSDIKYFTKSDYSDTNWSDNLIRRKISMSSNLIDGNIDYNTGSIVADKIQINLPISSTLERKYVSYVYLYDKWDNELEKDFSPYLASGKLEQNYNKVFVGRDRNECTLIEIGNITEHYIFPYEYDCQFYGDVIFIENGDGVSNLRQVSLNEIEVFSEERPPSTVSISTVEGGIGGHIYYMGDKITLQVESSGDIEDIKFYCNNNNALDRVPMLGDFSSCFDSVEFEFDNPDAIGLIGSDSPGDTEPARNYLKTKTSMVLGTSILTQGDLAIMACIPGDADLLSGFCSIINFSFRLTRIEGFPEASFRCIRNCQAKFDYFSIGAFKFHCKNCPKDGNLKIEGLLPEFNEIDGTDLPDEWSRDFVVPVGTITAGQMETISAEFSTSLFPSTLETPLKSYYRIIGNIPPANGTCQLLNSNVNTTSYVQVAGVIIEDLNNPLGQGAISQEFFASDYSANLTALANQLASQVQSSPSNSTNVTTTASPSFDGSSFNSDFCQTLCNDCDLFILKNNNQTCQTIQNSTYISTNTFFSPNGITADQTDEFIFQKTVLGLEPITGSFQMSCQDWEGGSIDFIYKIDILLPDENMADGENSGLRPKNQRLNLMTSKPNSTNPAIIAETSIPMIKILKTIPIQVTVCDTLRFCTVVPEIYNIELVEPNAAEVNAKLGAMIENLDVTQVDAQELASVASLALSSGTLSDDVKANLAGAVASAAVSTPIDSLPPTEMVQMLGTVEMITDVLDDPDTQANLQSSIGGSVDGMINSRDLSDAERTGAYTSVGSISDAITAKAIPESEDLAAGFSGSEETAEAQDAADKSREELMAEAKARQQAQIQNARNSQVFTGGIISETRNINDKLANGLSAQIIGQGTASITSGGATITASSGNSNGSAISTGSLKISGGATSTPLAISETSNSLVVKKRDAQIAKVVDLKPNCPVNTTCSSSEPMTLAITQSSSISDSRRRRKREASIRQRKRRSTTVNLNVTSSGSSGSLDGTMHFSTFRVNTQYSGVVLVIEPADDQGLSVLFDVYIAANREPTLEDYDLKYNLPYDLEIWDMDAAYDNWKIFMDIETVRSYSTKLYTQEVTDNGGITDTGDLWYVGVIKSSETIETVITIVSPSCRTFDSSTEIWQSNNCELGKRTNLEDVECICLQPEGSDGGLTIGTEFFSPPNTIDFGSVFQKFDVSDNPAVFSTIIAFFGVYLLTLLFYTIRRDKSDVVKWKLYQLYDNVRYNRKRTVLYQVTITTSSKPYSGTESRVYLKLFPSSCKSKLRPRPLVDSEKNTIHFTRGSVKNFIMREKNIKNFSHLHIWHDNRGGGWNCETIIVKNLETQEIHTFHVRDWLSIEHGNCMVDKVVPATDLNKDFDSFFSLVSSTLWMKMVDDHIWVSVFVRGYKSSFNRTQRWTVCFALLFITFVANCMWFETGKPGKALISIGPIEMSQSQIWASVASSLVAIPPIVLIMFLFKQTESGEKKKLRSISYLATRDLSTRATDNRAVKSSTMLDTTIPSEEHNSPAVSKWKFWQRRSKNSNSENEKDNNESTPKYDSPKMNARRRNSVPMLKNSSESGTLDVDQMMSETIMGLDRSETNDTDIIYSPFSNGRRGFGDNKIYPIDRVVSTKTTSTRRVISPESIAQTAYSFDNVDVIDDEYSDNFVQSRPNSNQKAIALAEPSSHSVAASKASLPVTVFEDVNNNNGDCCSLPHWTLYLWYLLAYAAMIVSAFFTILYSMQWGKAKSERWLTNALSTFVLDLLIMQPLKVSLLTIFLVVVWKKINTVKIMLNSVSRYEIYTCVTEDNSKESREEKKIRKAKLIEEEQLEGSGKEPKAPNSNQLRFAKWNMKNEKKMSTLIWEFFIHILYVSCLMLLTNMLRGSDQFVWVDKMHASFNHKIHYQLNLNDFNTFWTWMDEVAIPKIYREMDYTGERLDWRTRKFMDDMTSYRVGPVRLRQIRRIPKSCVDYSKEQIHYWQDYGMHPDRSPCGQGNTEQSFVKAGSWYNLPLSPKELTWAFEDGNLWELAWIYQTEQALRGVPFKGEIEFYGGDGYSAELGVNLMTALELTQRLKDSAWLDGHTKVVFLEFTLYNPAVNLFSSINYAFEIPEFAGTGVIKNHNYASYQVYSYDDEQATVLLVCQLIFVIHLIRSIFRLIWECKDRGFINWIWRDKSFWNWFGFAMILCDIAVIAFYVAREIMARETLDRFQLDEGRRFVNFGYNAQVSKSLISALALATLLSIIKILKMLRFNQKVGLLSLILRSAGSTMAGPAVAFGIAMVAHAWLMTLVFSSSQYTFRSIVSTTANWMTYMLGETSYRNFIDFKKPNNTPVQKTTATIFYFTFAVIMIVFILNFIISVIDAAMSVGHEQNMFQNAEDFELARFMSNKVASYFSKIKKTPKQTVNKMKRKRIEGKTIEVGKNLQICLENLEHKLNEMLAEAIVDNNGAKVQLRRSCSRCGHMSNPCEVCDVFADQFTTHEVKFESLKY